MKNWHYASLVFLGGCSFGVLATFVKLAYANSFTINEVVGSQFTIGLVLIWGAALFTKRIKLSRKKTLQLVIAGLPMGLTGVFYYQSLQTLDASLAIIFLFQFVWIGTLFEWVIDKKVPTRGKVISIIILLVGSLLSSGYLTAGVASLPWQGAVWGILAAFTFSAFIYISGSVARGVPPLQKSALLSTGAFIIVTIIFPPLFFFDVPVLVGIAPYAVFLGLFGVVLPPLLFSIGMPHVGPGLGTILSASELPVAVIMSALVLAEFVSGLQWFGVLLILGGIIVGNVNFTQSKLKPHRSTV